MENCLRAPCRVTTSAPQPTCPSVSWSVAVASLYQWSTPPTWWTYGKRPPVSWRFTHRTLSTVGPWMMSSSLPTRLAWQVRRTRTRHKTLEVKVLKTGLLHALCNVCVKALFVLSLFSQTCRCMCATKKLTGISQCRCAPTQPCRMRQRVSYIHSLRSWVSQEVKNQTMMFSLCSLLLLNGEFTCDEVYKRTPHCDCGVL